MYFKLYIYTYRTVIENSAVTLSCPVTGKPEPIVEWFKDGELLTAFNITKRIDTGHLNGNDLKITRVNVSYLMKLLF